MVLVEVVQFQKMIEDHPELIVVSEKALLLILLPKVVVEEERIQALTPLAVVVDAEVEVVLVTEKPAALKLNQEQIQDINSNLDLYNLELQAELLQWIPETVMMEVAVEAALVVPEGQEDREVPHLTSL